jgi:hypothetical protein
MPIIKIKNSTTNLRPTSLALGESAVYVNPEGMPTVYIGNQNGVPMVVNDEAILITSIEINSTPKPTANGYYIFASIPSDGLPAGIALNDIAILSNEIWYLVRTYAFAPGTIKVGLTNQVIYNKNGGSWSSIQSSIVGSASAVKFYLQAPVINARTLPAGISQDGVSGTGIQTMTASLIPSTLAVATYSGTSNAIDTRAFASFTSNTNLNVTSIPAGSWSFDFWAFANNTTGANLRKGVYQVITGTNTATVSGATANIRTVTLTSGQFSGTYFAANVTNTIASYISLPSGIYQISAITSTNSATIRVPTGYVNETAVAFNVWNLLFLTSIVAITKANAPTVKFEIRHQTTVPYTTNLTDKLGIIDFAVIATANRIITVEYGGNTSVNTVTTSIPFIDVNKADKVPNALAISNLATGGSIGLAAATVDIYEKFNITQTTASQNITLPTPSNINNKKIVYVENTGNTSFAMYSMPVAPLTHIALIFNGTAWIPQNIANAVNTVDYLLATRNTSLNYVTNTFYIPNLIQAGSIPVNTTTGAITLQAGKTYELTAQMRIVGTVTQFTFYRWADFNSKAVLFSSSHGENESNNATSANSNAPIATCIYTPTVDQTVGLLFDGLPPTANTIEGFSSFILVKQIGSTAVPSNADGTVGGVKYALMNNTEVATGDTFLTGQPIYRKVIPFTNRAAGSGTVLDATLTSTYCVNVIRCYGMFKEAGGTTLIIGSGSISGNALVVNTYLFTNGLFLEVGSARSSTNSGYVIIEYTKS